MRLNEFVAGFGSLDDESLASVAHAYLLEVCAEKPGSEREVFLLRAADQPVRVGRSRHCYVQVRDDRVSNAHAQLLPPLAASEPWRIEELGSTNGTCLDGEPLTAGSPPAPLADRSILRFGPDARFLFLDPASIVPIVRAVQAQLRLAAVAPSSVSNETAGVGPEDGPGELVGTSSISLLRATRPLRSDELQRTVQDPPEEREAGAVQDVYLLQCEPFDPVVLELDRPVVLGRSPRHADLVLPHEQVSRRHAEVVRRADGVWVRDLGSANGTFVGGDQVGLRPVALLLGKELIVGPFSLQVLGPSERLQRTQVRRATAGDGSLDWLADGTVVDLLQKVEADRLTGRLEVVSDDGSRAEVSFRQGKPCAASTGGGLAGVEAVRHIMRLVEGHCQLHEGDDEAPQEQLGPSFTDLLIDSYLTGS